MKVGSAPEKIEIPELQLHRVKQEHTNYFKPIEMYVIWRTGSEMISHALIIDEEEYRFEGITHYIWAAGAWNKMDTSIEAIMEITDNLNLTDHLRRMAAVLDLLNIPGGVAGDE